MPLPFRAHRSAAFVCLVAILLVPALAGPAFAQTAPPLCTQSQCDTLGQGQFFCGVDTPYACVGSVSLGGCNASPTFWNQTNCGGPACDARICPWNANAAQGAPPTADRTLTLVNQCPFGVLAGFTGGAFAFHDGSTLPCGASGQCPSGQTCNTAQNACFWTLPNNEIRFPLASQGSQAVPLTNDAKSNGDPTAPQFTKWSGNVWAATGCTGTDGVDCATAPCPTGGCTPFTGPLGPRTAAEFTFVNNAQDFYDVSTIDGTNIPVEMKPTAGQTLALLPSGADGQYYCTNPGGTTSQSSQLNGCGWTVDPTVGGTDESVLAHMVVPSATTPTACTGDSDCTSPEVCGQQYDASAASLSQVCGVQVAWLNANGICKATGEKGQVGSVDCTALVTGTLDRADLYGCTTGIFGNSCYSDGATSDCCGCENWQGVLATSQCNASNQDWQNLAEPWAQVFKDACPTAYSYPFDDKTSTFTCRTALTSVTDFSAPGDANSVDYTITFCPGGGTGGVTVP